MLCGLDEIKTKKKKTIVCAYENGLMQVGNKSKFILKKKEDSALHTAKRTKRKNYNAKSSTLHNSKARIVYQPIMYYKLLQTHFPWDQLMEVHKKII